MLIGIDIGTSATKGVITDGGGRVLASASAGYELSRPRDGWSEQRATDWWQAVCTVTRRLLSDARAGAGSVSAVGLSGQMHGSVLLSIQALQGAGTGPIDALRPVLLWNDQRTEQQCRQIEAGAGGRLALVRAVGNAAPAGLTLPKVLWVAQHEPQVFARTAKVVCPKDFIRLQLTGELATDISEASGWPLVDLATRTWHTPLLDALGLDPSILPPILESGAVAGTITCWAAEQTGLAEGTPIVAGAGDNMAGAIGAGVASPGAVLATLGTSGVIYAHAEQARPDTGQPESPGRLQCMGAGDGTASRPGQWATTGCMLSAAGSLAWARDTIAPGVELDNLMDEAGAAPAGCEGLVFLPHLSGERCPYPNPQARGGWIGLTARHTRAHLIRAVLEGVAITMAQMLGLVRSAGVPVHEVRLGGGGARAPVWRQILADAFGHPVTSLGAEEGPAHGAALLAGVGVNLWPSVRHAIDAAITTGEVRQPEPGRAALYRDLSERYARTYRQLHESRTQ